MYYIKLKFNYIIFVFYTNIKTHYEINKSKILYYLHAEVDIYRISSGQKRGHFL